MQWILLGMAIVFLIVAYIVMQGTRAAMAWRKAADDGDVKIIGEIVEDSLIEWRSKKKPKEIAVDVWRGLQSTELVEVAADFVRVSCQAESEYRREGKSWVETANPIQTGMAITARVAEMVLYDLPHFRPARIQIDVYTTFRDGEGGSPNHDNQSLEPVIAEVVNQALKYRDPIDFNEAFGYRIRQGL